MKRKGYINWDQYFMGVAELSSLRSKDPNTQVGCCIASPDNKIYSLGYNGMPRGLSDDKFPWDNKSKNLMDTKYPYVCHSELNAILNFTGHSLKGCRLYVTLFPCNECAKAIVQSGIVEVIYRDMLYPNTIQTKVAKKMFKAAKVKITKYKNMNKEIKLIV